MGIAFYYCDAKSNWRGPIAIGNFFPCYILLVAWLSVESPRFLLMTDRADDTWNIVRDLHTDMKDSAQSFARGEFYQMQKQAHFDRSMDSRWITLLTKKSYRKRLMLSAGFACIGQSTGILVVRNYVSIL
jgi:hypothetical protein